MKLRDRFKKIWLLYYFVSLLLALSAAGCDLDAQCNILSYDKQCCHGTCIARESTCISGAAIAGIVIGCLIVGGIIISCCLCFCCACGPFQNRTQGAVIRYGGHATATTTTGTSTYPQANMQPGYATSYPQPGTVQYPNSMPTQGHYSQPGAAPYPSAVQGQSPYPSQTSNAYPPATTSPPSYEEANKPPPYNPGYPQ